VDGRLGGNQPTLHKEFQVLSRINSQNEYPHPKFSLTLEEQNKRESKLIC
jgi:hypothetical protein